MSCRAFPIPLRRAPQASEEGLVGAQGDWRPTIRLKEGDREVEPQRKLGERRRPRPRDTILELADRRCAHTDEFSELEPPQSAELSGETEALRIEEGGGRLRVGPHDPPVSSI